MTGIESTERMKFLVKKQISLAFYNEELNKEYVKETVLDKWFIIQNTYIAIY